MSDAPRQSPAGSPVVSERRPWSLPTLRELPKLTALTLASAIGGGGGTGGGGSTVFGLLLAAGLALLSACSADQPMEPSAPAMPKAVASISCVGDVAKGVVNCTAPQTAAGQAILGGQGLEVALRSSNVSYDDPTGDFTFDVTVQNLSAQIIGYNGVSATGIRVFFVSGPTVTGGFGAITVEDDSTGTFTAAGQHYYVWPGVSVGQRNLTAPLTWRLNMPNTVTTFSFTVEVAADVVDQGGVYRWSAMTGFDQTAYLDVAAESATDQMAVGFNGATAHWNGTSWVTLPAIVSENINAVIGIGPGEYLAATATGAVLHFKNNVWTEIYRRGDFGTFNAIWAKGMTQIVAVGDAGRTSHAYGGVWTDEDLPTLNGGKLTAVSGSADGSHVSAINGDFLSSEVWTSTLEGAFVTDPTFPAAVVGLATDVTYDAAGDGLVSFVDVGGPMISYIIRTNGDTVLFLNDVWPKALVPHGSDQLAVGYLYNGDGFHYVSDLDYSTIPGSFNGLTDPLGPPFDITQMSAIDAGATQFVVVSGNGHLLRWTGTFWADPQGTGSFQDPDLWGVGDSLWALDGIGGFYKIVDGVATAKPGLSGLIRLWGSSSTSFFAIDNTSVYSSDGSSGWNLEVTIPGSTNNRDIWADPTGAAVIALGENGVIASRILGTWGLTSIPRNVNAVWGCDAHTAWIATQEGEVWKWVDGVTTLDIALTGAPILRGVAGTSCSDVWVVGDGAEEAHWNGTTWTDPGAVGVPSLRAIAMGGPGEFYFGTGGGSAFVATSSGNYDLYFPGQGRAIKSMWRLDNGEVYAAGDNFFYRGHQ